MTDSNVSAENLVAHLEGVTKAIKNLDVNSLPCQGEQFLP